MAVPAASSGPPPDRGRRVTSDTIQRREQELTEFLAARMSIESVAEFYERFSDYRIPKRPQHLVQQQRVRILFAALVRAVPTGCTLTQAMAEAVAIELRTSPDHVRRVWSAWNRVGRPRRKNGTVRDATTPSSFRW